MDATAHLQGLLLAEELEALASVRAKVAAQGLEVWFAALPRLVGKRMLAGRVEVPRAVDLEAWRACDAAGALLLLESSREGAALFELFRQGDSEERRMLLRALQVMEVAEDAAVRILVEAHRCNDQVLFEAAMLDGALATAVLPAIDWNNAVLKAAFLGLSLDRFFGWEARGDAELSRTLLDFMSEREAANRAVWSDSLRAAAAHPVAGVAARLLAELWHGDDARRGHALEAARRVLATGEESYAAARATVRAALEERRDHEAAPALARRVAELLAS